jgi:peptidoglycan/LPS O-acetylase OafA/YrhL
LPGGFIGVSIFFVISGFLITRLIADEVSRGDFSIRAFYARRVRRLLPAAVAVFVASFVAGAAVLAPSALGDFGRSMVAADLLHANVHFAAETGYFDAPSHEKPLLHFWSLSIEEQYYLVWPLLLALLLPRMGKGGTLVAVAAVLLISLGYAETMARSDADRTFYSLGARAWELMIGAVLALSLDRLRPTRWSAECLGALGVSLLVSSLFFLDESVTFPGFSALPACLGTAAVLASGHHRSTILSRALSSRIPVYIGLISYSLYLWHWPILSFGRYFVERDLLPTESAMLVVISLALAAMSYRWIEQPFRSAGGRFRSDDRSTLRMGALSMGLIALLGGVVQIDGGWVWRFGPEARDLFERRSKLNPYEARCDNIQNIFRNDRFCNFGRPKDASGSFDLAVFGDSNADHFVPLLARYANVEGLSGRQVTQTACAGVLGVRVPGRTPAKHAQCLAYQEAIIRFVEQNPGLELAVISGNWSSYQGRLGSSRLVIPPVPEKPPVTGDPATIDYHLRATIHYLRGRGIRVHLISQIPYQDGLPLRCVLESLRAGRNTDHCGIAASRAKAATRPTDELFRHLADTIDGVTATIPTDIMCRELVCPILMEGVLLYRDEAHLNADGAAYLYGRIRMPPLGP